MVTLLPPAARITEAKIALVLLMVSSCLSRIIFSSRLQLRKNNNNNNNKENKKKEKEGDNELKMSFFIKQTKNCR